MRVILDEVDPSDLRPVFASIFKLLSRAGLLKRYRFWQQYLLLSIDGVEHFCSTKVHCSSCTTRTKRDGEISYHHSGLAAVLVHPEQREVFVLEFEPVLRQDGEKKNDCERNAAKRLCTALKERYPDLKFILVEDALYANAPHILQITDECKWDYVLNVKPDSHKSLEKQFAGRRERGQVKESRLKDDQGIEHYFAWTNDLCLSESAAETHVLMNNCYSDYAQRNAQQLIDFLAD